MVVAVVALLGAAGYFTWTSTSPKIVQPDTPDSAAPCICMACGETFRLTPAGYSRLSKEGGVRRDGDGRGGRVHIRCPKCGKLEAVNAMECPKDQSIFPLTDKNGQPGKCPKCGWQP